MPKSETHIIQGKIWLLGDQIDTDLIVPSRVLTEQDKSKMLAATLELILPQFSQNVQLGDIIVAGKNFGCGSSREEAVFVLKELGISAIIAQSFARIFFRNCINLGLPAIIIPKFVVNSNDFLQIDLDNGEIYNENTKLHYNFQPFPPFLKKIINSGGILNVLNQKNED